MGKKVEEEKGKFIILLYAKAQTRWEQRICFCVSHHHSHSFRSMLCALFGGFRHQFFSHLYVWYQNHNQKLSLFKIIFANTYVHFFTQSQPTHFDKFHFPSLIFFSHTYALWCAWERFVCMRMAMYATPFINPCIIWIERLTRYKFLAWFFPSNEFNWISREWAIHGKWITSHRFNWTNGAYIWWSCTKIKWNEMK